MSKKLRVARVTSALLGFQPGDHVIITAYRGRTRGTLREQFLVSSASVWIVDTVTGPDVVAEEELERAE